MKPRAHWERIYTTKSPQEVSWFQEHPQCSLRLIEEAGISKSDFIIDVGGGASTLVDDLIESGYQNLAVLDVSSAALAASQARLGRRAAQVNWITANVLEAELPAAQYDLWHDRAVFHFLTEKADRAAYLQKAESSVKQRGFVLIATFAEDGPSQCSGLPVRRYSPESLSKEVGDVFQLENYVREVHHTPAGHEQKFIYCLFRKAG